jgi:hypothetical protein
MNFVRSLSLTCRLTAVAMFALGQKTLCARALGLLMESEALKGAGRRRTPALSLSIPTSLNQPSPLIGLRSDALVFAV